MQWVISLVSLRWCQPFQKSAWPERMSPDESASASRSAAGIAGKSIASCSCGIGTGCSGGHSPAELYATCRDGSGTIGLRASAPFQQSGKVIHKRKPALPLRRLGSPVQSGGSAEWRPPAPHDQATTDSGCGSIAV